LTTKLLKYKIPHMEEKPLFRGVNNSTSLGVNTYGETALEARLMQQKCAGCSTEINSKGFPICPKGVDTEFVVLPGTFLLSEVKIFNRACPRHS
jgi:hypothetical protein